MHDLSVPATGGPRLDAALIRAALDTPWPNGAVHTLLFFERYIPAARKRVAEDIFGPLGHRLGGSIHTALREALQVQGGRRLLVGTSIVTETPAHRGVLVCTHGTGPWLEVTAGELTLVVGTSVDPDATSDAADLLDATLLDGPLPFGDRRVTYRPRSSLEAAEALAADALAGTGLDDPFARTPTERINDRFVHPPDLEAVWLCARALDELVGEGRNAAWIDEVYAKACKEERAMVGEWLERRAVLALLDRLSHALPSCGGALKMGGHQVSVIGDRLVVRSQFSSTALTVSRRGLEKGHLDLGIAGWDQRAHELEAEGSNIMGPVPPLDVLLELALELDEIEQDLPELSS